MAHQIEGTPDAVASAEYSWRFDGEQHILKLTTQGPAQELCDGSEAEFITEHYWGYNRQRAGSTLEYRVEHPRWRIYETSEARLDCDVGSLYGERFCNALNSKPASAFLAEGSAVSVFKGAHVPR